LNARKKPSQFEKEKQKSPLLNGTCTIHDTVKKPIKPLVLSVRFDHFHLPFRWPLCPSACATDGTAAASAKTVGFSFSCPLTPAQPACLGPTASGILLCGRDSAHQPVGGLVLVIFYPAAPCLAGRITMEASLTRFTEPQPLDTNKPASLPSFVLVQQVL
jgi:hypothetical protein